jgi:hypothetical protein
MEWNELPLDPRHLWVLSGASKMIFKPMVYSAQFVQLSCAEINTISKHIEAIFHLIYATKEYHLVCSKRFQGIECEFRSSLPRQEWNWTVSAQKVKRMRSRKNSTSWTRLWKNLCQMVQMNRISQALLFLFLALSALEWHFISHVENSAHCV